MKQEYKRILGPLIKKIHWQIDKMANEAFKECDLTVSQSDVLRYLHHAKYKGFSISQKDIEKHLNISNPTVSGILDRLEDKGFINRINDPDDNRKKLIIQTEKADHLNNMIIEKFNTFDEYMLSCLDEEEKNQLFNSLEKIIVHLKKGEANK